MRVLSAASVLVTLVFCTADDIVPRWSKPDDARSQGEWVPLKNDRISQQPIRIPSAITSLRHEHDRAFPHQSSSNQFIGDYPKQEMVASHTAPQRVSYVNPHGLGQQQILQQQLQLPPQLPTQLQPQLQQQLDSQQLLTQFLNQQIQQGSLPIFNRELLQKQPIQNPPYFTQANHYNLVPMYNQGQLIQNEQYPVSDERELSGKLLSKDALREGVPDSSYEKTKYIGEPFNSNLSSTEDSNQKEEIQILYVPVEMLKQQEQSIRNKVGKKIEQNHPHPKELYSAEPHQQNPEIQHANHKESRKFRHPIQPLKDQVPAYYLKQQPVPQGKTAYPNAETINEEIKGAKHLVPNQEYLNHKAHLQSRGEYSQKYEAPSTSLGGSRHGTSGNKEQSVDESTIKDEISDYRHGEQDRNSHKDYLNKAEPSLPPPNQPPLSVFMEKTTSNRLGDLVGLLRGSKTIPVLDSIGPDSPQVFVGPSNLQAPSGYLKYELPYLSSLDNYQTTDKLSQVPFFVAPLNFQPPPGFAKIPFPPPHIGSVVLSNLTQQTLPIEQPPLTQPNADIRSTNYNKETFTIPADISSISPQLPSLINSLQEEEYSSTSSTEKLTESTEATPIKQRRPNSSRRFNSRGSQRGSVSYSSTTKRPVSRQRRPLSRNSNHRTTHYSETATNVPETPTENHYDTDSYYSNYKSNKGPSSISEKGTSEQKLSETPQFSQDDRNLAGIQYTRPLENVKQDEISKENNNRDFEDQNPTYNSKYSNDDTIPTAPGRNSDYYSPENINKNVAHSNSPQFHSTSNSDEAYDEYHTSDFNEKPTRNTLAPAEKHYPTVSTTRKYDDAIAYQQEAHRTPSYSDESSGASDDEDVNYRKRHRDSSSKPPTITEQNYNYRQTEQKIESPHSMQDSDYSREGLNKESISYPTNPRQREHQQHHMEDTKSLNSPYITSSYVSSNEDQSTTPYILKSNYGSASQESLEPYQHIQSPDKLTDSVQMKHKYHEDPQTANKNEDYNDRAQYDANVSEPQKPTTERTFPTRSRSRGRGRPYQQYKQTSTESPVSVSSFEDSNESSHYSKSDVTTSSPGRRYPHGRAHRRPIRPTVSTTTTTTTNAPPGTKYLIRTRRPSVPQTKLHGGRGRIRKPTTPTTTLPTTTTQHLETLPILWQQPHNLNPSQNDYRLKEGAKQTQSSGFDSSEYIEETPTYSDERVNDKSIYEPQNERTRDAVQTKKFSGSDAPRRVPINYSYEAQEENLPIQKQYRTTQQPYYADDYESTPKVHYYLTTQKQQYFREYETTQKPKHSKEYETTPKAHYPRNYETTQKTHYREYETTQKPHYVRDETTQKAQYFRDYETTQEPQYSRDYETTPKHQYYKEYETTPKPQYYREYETTQNPQHFRDHDPKAFNSYETTKRYYSNDYETTEKPKNYKENNYYDGTKKAENYQDYETTSRPYADPDVNQKQTYSHSARQPVRNGSHRRRPSSPVATRAEPAKHVKPTRGEVPDKSSDPEYWNQAVTIQQSQSYVYNPDETYSDERQAAPPADSKYESSQNDYDDYYSTQESEQYSSDQAPYPSNEQRITYTKIKASDYTGKASQYPQKDDSQITDETREEEQVRSSDQTFFVRQNKTNSADESANHGYKIKHQTPIPDYGENSNSAAESEELQHNSGTVQGNKRRGTWIRRRIKKPQDMLEAAESQRYSTVRENSLISEPKPKEGQFNNSMKENLFGKQKEKHHQRNQTTSIAQIGEVIETHKQIVNSKKNEDKTSETEEKGSSTEENDFLDVKGITTEKTSEKEEKLNTNQVPTITTVPSDPITETSEPYRTSTTTEISLETEICYKGQCIKTKRRKEEGASIPLPTVKT